MGGGGLIGGATRPLFGDTRVKEPKSSKQLAGMSQALFEQTDPLRRNLIGSSMDFLEGGVTSSPVFQALQNAANIQFGNARENILSTVPRGGSLTQALTDAELSRADTLTQGMGNIFQNEMARATSLATGSPLSTSAQGLGAAGAQQAGVSAANAAANAQVKSGIGQGVGSMMGGKK